MIIKYGRIKIKCKESTQYLHKVALIDLETKKLFYDKLFYIYIEVPNFKKEEKQLTEKVDKWIYFLKNLSNFANIPDVLKGEMFMKAFNIAEIANFTDEQKFAYDQSIKYYRDLKNSFDTAFESGEKQKAEEIATNMLKMELDVKIVSQATGLTILEIEELKKTLE